MAADLRKEMLRKRMLVAGGASDGTLAPLAVSAPWASCTSASQTLMEEHKEEEEEEEVHQGQMGAPALHVPKQKKRQQEFSAVSWDEYFETKEQIAGLNVFQAGLRKTQSSEHVQHEAGATATTAVPWVLMLHGAGHTALSWAHVAKRLAPHCRIIAYDMRGHGESLQVEAEAEAGAEAEAEMETIDWSTERLCADAVRVLEALVAAPAADSSASPAPRVVIVGHSMGGAIAARVAHAIPRAWLAGLVLIDVVEGTALEALPSMQRIIANRPTTFPDVATAIRWAKANHVVRNVQSARVSIPSQLMPTHAAAPAASAAVRWKWRVALEQTEPYWRDWFTGLSNCFLSAPCPKLLLLAGTDRLDKPLTIGQMQGKFQLELLPQAGHVVQEDEPDATAAKLLRFIRRCLTVVDVARLHQ